MENIIIKYQSLKQEISEREISNVSSQVADNCNKIICAYCHLRNATRSFILDSILEIRVNGKIVDKERFWKENIKDKNALTKELNKLLIKKKKEYEYYVGSIDAIVKMALEDDR